MSRLRPNWTRIYGVLAVVATAMLAACVLWTGQASGRVRASLRSGEEWSERLDRYERLEALAGAVSDRVRAVVWSPKPEAERLRLKAGLDAFNLAYAEAVGELLEAPSAETNAVLRELHEIDGAMTEAVGQAEAVFARRLAESGAEEPELHVVLGALSTGFAALGTHVRAIQDRNFGAQQTAADSRRLAEQVLGAAAAFLILGILYYGSRLLGRPDPAVSLA